MMIELETRHIQFNTKGRTHIVDITDMVFTEEGCFITFFFKDFSDSDFIVRHTDRMHRENHLG